MNRFDLTKTQRDFINAAVTTGLVDATEILCMGTEFTTFADFRTEIMEAAHCNRHCPEGQEVNRVLCTLNDACFVEERDAAKKGGN